MARLLLHEGLTRVRHSFEAGAVGLWVVAACAACAVAPKDGLNSSNQPQAHSGGEESSSSANAIVGRPVDGESANPVRRERSTADDRRYSLAIAAAAARVGETTQVAIVVEPRAEWHLNLEYETRLTVEAVEDVSVEKAQLRSGDAVVYSEDRFEFAFPFVASAAGEKRFVGELRFALCRGEELCAAVVEPVSFAVLVH